MSRNQVGIFLLISALGAAIMGIVVGLVVAALGGNAVTAMASGGAALIATCTLAFTAIGLLRGTGRN